MHDFQEQRETVFRATECLSLFSSKQCLIKQLLDWMFCDIWSNLGKCNRSRGNYVYYSFKMNPSPFHIDGLSDG